MNKKLSLQERHDLIDAELKAAPDKYLKERPQTITYGEIGARLGVTGQTVINHINGEGRDGYLKEAILEEFKAL